MDNMDKTQRLARTTSCPSCGEEYSITYRRCPFCGGNQKAKTPRAGSDIDIQGPSDIDIQGPGDAPTEPSPTAAQTATAVMEAVEEFVPDFNIDFTPEIEDEESSIPKPPAGNKGGSRLAKPVHGGSRSSGSRSRSSGSRSGGSRDDGGNKGGGGGFVRGLLRVLSILIIAAAVYIVVTRVVPLVQEIRGNEPSGQQGGENDPNAVEPNEENFTLTEISVTLTAPGATKQMVPIYEPVEEIGHLVWSSDTPSVVTVSEEGRLTAVAPGTAVVSVRRTDGSEARCSVSCVWSEDSLLENLSLNLDDFTVRSGEAPVQMRVVGIEGTPPEILWASADPAIATVSDSGVITWISPGVTTVTATINGMTLQCTVRCK